MPLVVVSGVILGCERGKVSRDRGFLRWEVPVAIRVGQGPHGQAVRLDVSSVARYLQEVLGQNLTAVLAGVRDVKAVGKWARGARLPHPQAEKRLRDAYQVAHLLMEVESPKTVRAWFLGMNPELEDRAPAVILPEDPEAVLHAARFFVANG
jgi:hypothetical protein